MQTIIITGGEEIPDDDNEYLTIEEATKAGWFPWLVDDSKETKSGI